LHWPGVDAGCKTKRICDGVTPVVRFPPYVDLNIWAVATVSSSVALFSGTHADTAASMVARTDRQGSVRIYPIDFGGGMPLQLAFDGERTVWGATDSGIVYQIDVLDDTTRIANLGLLGGQLAVGNEGTVLFGNSSRIYQLSAGSTRARDQALFPIPAGLKQFKWVGRDRILALDDAGLETFTGAGWALEFDGPELSMTPLWITADAGMMGMVAGTAGLIRDEARHIWTPIAIPTGLEPHGIAALTGRLMAVGVLGGINIYDRDAWCSIYGVPVKTMVAASVSPDRKTVVAVSWSRPGGPVVVWMDLP
jgi:hypothetical protein